MRLISLSDTHGLHDKFTIPDGDVLIHAGDACNSGSRDDFLSFIKWFSALPHQHKIYIPGNHDWYVQIAPEAAAECCAYNNILMPIDYGFTIEDKLFYGTPWTPIFMNWAFMMNETDLAKQFSLFPPEIDVLISHGPPYGYLDAAKDYEMGYKSVGSTALRTAIEERSPKIVICGHVHEGRAIGEAELGDTKLYNVSCLNEKYQAIYQPVIIDI